MVCNRKAAERYTVNHTNDIPASVINLGFFLCALYLFLFESLIYAFVATEEAAATLRTEAEMPEEVWLELLSLLIVAGLLCFGQFGPAAITYLLCGCVSSYYRQRL